MYKIKITGFVCFDIDNVANNANSISILLFVIT